RLPVAIEREISAAATRREKVTLEQQRVLDRENFVSIVAHDLRAPVKRVEAMVQVLREDYEEELDEGGSDIIKRIERSTNRLCQMLNSLLAYARYSRGAITGKVASLAHMINEVRENLVEPSAAKFDIKLDQVNDVAGDPILIGHVLQNLISN